MKQKGDFFPSVPGMVPKSIQNSNKTITMLETTMTWFLPEWPLLSHQPSIQDHMPRWNSPQYLGTKEIAHKVPGRDRTRICVRASTVTVLLPRYPYIWCRSFTQQHPSLLLEKLPRVQGWTRASGYYYDWEVVGVTQLIWVVAMAKWFYLFMILAVSLFAADDPFTRQARHWW